ncbi:hypothetical protein B0T17DRAFT_179115 [Bombardia bombarda]|uniref:Uncharacterized protein n=1 Tax=Bombardia bombarda TaxID=252184 RepID=A0AA40C8J6_9PEZI|nr:hypothetical protein B0T17DRAFT_179115 [Bombardia bombarda]
MCVSPRNLVTLIHPCALKLLNIESCDLPPRDSLRQPLKTTLGVINPRRYTGLLIEQKDHGIPLQKFAVVMDDDTPYQGIDVYAGERIVTNHAGISGSDVQDIFRLPSITGPDTQSLRDSNAMDTTISGNSQVLFAITTPETSLMSDGISFNNLHTGKDLSYLGGASSDAGTCQSTETLGYFAKWEGN